MPAQPTEVDAYIWIKRNLDLLKWDARNPLRSPSGQVYTQNEVFADPIIGDVLKPKKPENVVQIDTTTFWIIEAKRKHGQLRQAVREAENYADRVNKAKGKKGAKPKALFVTGVAGNDEDSYLVENRFWNGHDYVPITANGVPLSALLSPVIVQEVLDNGPDLEEAPLEIGLFLSKAELINEILHEGAVNKNYRAKVMAAVLLAILEDVPNLAVDPTLLIRDINSRAERALRKENKGEFFPFIELALPPTEDNHVKFKRALVQTIQELLNLNIRSAMRSGHDVLGKFYEVFLKYGNGAKEIGIVLTPRHVTRFAVEAVGVSDRDTVYDPTCGTGGFLVAAFDHVRKSAGAAAIERFKEHNLFGIEHEAEVAALAIVNMIFRGDGKTNIREGNCFGWRLIRDDRGGGTVKFVKDRHEGVPGISRVLMNPPFKSKKGEEYEFKFVDHALNQLEEGGLLFSVLPYGVMVRAGQYKTWRQRLLRNHTLLAVLTLPPDLFYPVDTNTVAIIVKKGTPHPPEQPTLWVRSIFDGQVKSKGKRLPSGAVPDDLARIIDDVRAFVSKPSSRVPNVARFMKAAPVNTEDKHLELVPEAYLDQAPLSVQDVRQELDQAVRSTLAFLIDVNLYRPGFTPVKSGEGPLFEGVGKKAEVPAGPLRWREFKLSDLFEIRAGDFHATKELDPGGVPLISCGDANQGLVGFYDVEAGMQHRNALTVAFNGSPLTSKYHPYPFGAKDDVGILEPLGASSPAFMQFVAAMLSSMKWRYHYGRKCFRNKLNSLTVALPVDDDGEIDLGFIEAAVEATPYWDHVVAAGESAKLPDVSPLSSLDAVLRSRSDLPFPETDLSPTLQRTIAAKLAAGEDDAVDEGVLMENLERASEAR